VGGGRLPVEPAPARASKTASDAPARKTDTPPKPPLTEAQKIFGHKSMGARGKSKHREAG